MLAVYIIAEMSVDKFGRHYESKGGKAVEGPKGPPGVGFELTSDGHFHLGSKRLTNVGDPRHETDAVNLRAAMDYLDTVLPSKTGSYWGFGKRRLVSVADPIDDLDAVNKKYFLANCPKRSSDGNWDFENKRIKLSAAPVDSTDVVNKRYCTELEERVQHRVDAGDQKTSELESELKILASRVVRNRGDIERSLVKFGRYIFPYIETVIGREHMLGPSGTPLTADTYVDWIHVFNTQ